MNEAERARMDELLADRALVGLQAAEELELARLVAASGEPAGEEHEHAAAALDLALAPRTAALPAELRARLVRAAHARAEHASTAGRSASPTPPARGTPVLALTGWLVAAAACLVAVFALRAGEVGAPDPARERDELLARADTLRRDWTATEQAPGASGDVVWSQEVQQGFLRIRALAANDPAVAQYQLWIFDPTQEHPVDGGVFDVAAGEALIPIDAKLRVHAVPKLFAVTVEKPGGVVVSDQERIVLVAQL